MIALVVATAFAVLPHSLRAPSIFAASETAQTWSCQPRKTCGKIRSCDEAIYYLQNCSWGGRLDADSDGSPCENLCGSNN